MDATAAIVVWNCWRGVRDLKRLTAGSTSAAAATGGARGPEASGEPSGLVTAITPRPITPFQSPRQAAAAIRIFVKFISEVLSVLLTYLVSSGEGPQQAGKGEGEKRPDQHVGPPAVALSVG